LKDDNNVDDDNDYDDDDSLVSFFPYVKLNHNFWDVATSCNEFTFACGHKGMKTFTFNAWLLKNSQDQWKWKVRNHFRTAYDFFLIGTTSWAWSMGPSTACRFSAWLLSGWRILHMRRSLRCLSNICIAFQAISFYLLYHS